MSKEQSPITNRESPIINRESPIVESGILESGIPQSGIPQSGNPRIGETKNGRHGFGWIVGVLLSTSLHVVAHAQVLDRIVAVVDGAPITQSDVTAAMQLALVMVPPSTDAVTATVDALVERRLILEEVDRYAPPEPADAEIDRRVAEVRTRVGNRLPTILADVGLTDDQLRREVRDTLRIEAYLQQRFGPAQGSDERATMIREWLSGLRRRANINILPR